MSASTSPALGIDLGGTKIEARLLAPDGRETWRERIATPHSGYRATLDALAGLAARGRAAAGRCRLSPSVT